MSDSKLKYASFFWDRYVTQQALLVQHSFSLVSAFWSVSGEQRSLSLSLLSPDSWVLLSLDTVGSTPDATHPFSSRHEASASEINSEHGRGGRGKILQCHHRAAAAPNPDNTGFTKKQRLSGRGTSYFDTASWKGSWLRNKVPEEGKCLLHAMQLLSVH